MSASLSRQQKKRMRYRENRRNRIFQVLVYSPNYSSYVEVGEKVTPKDLLRKLMNLSPEMGALPSCPLTFRDKVLDPNESLRSQGVSSKDNKIDIRLPPLQKFDTLIPGVQYYAKAGTLYEDPQGKVFCENSFSFGLEKNYRCDAHTVPIFKNKKGTLTLGPGPSVKVRRGYVDEWMMKHHGPGVDRYMKTKIPVDFKVSDKNRRYTVSELPDGQTGWLTSWALQKQDDVYQVLSDYTVDVERYFANTSLFVKKEGNTLIVDPSTIEKEYEGPFSAERRYIQVVLRSIL